MAIHLSVCLLDKEAICLSIRLSRALFRFWGSLYNFSQLFFTGLLSGTLGTPLQALQVPLRTFQAPPGVPILCKGSLGLSSVLRLSVRLSHLLSRTCSFFFNELIRIKMWSMSMKFLDIYRHCILYSQTSI